MRKKLLAILLLSVLVASTFIGCEGGGSPCPSTLTILSITEGDVSVMKEGTDHWAPAEGEMELREGDTLKTGGNSSAEITFFDGSTMELEAGTEVKILSLDIVCATSVSTVTMEQTIGTTISRVTKLLDPGSSYEIETPTGVAGVRGSTMKVTVEYVTPQIINTLIENWEGNVYAFGQGAELQIPVGRTGLIASGQQPVLVNNPPVAEDDAAATDEDNPVTVAAPGVLNNDSDPDAGDTLAVTAVDTGETVGLVDAWGTDGSFIYNPNGQFEYLQAGSSTTDSFTYTVSDSYGGNDTATVTITVNGVNDPPVAVDDSATTTENTSVIIYVLNNDSDSDAGDILTVDSVTQGANGSVANNGSYVTYTPDAGFLCVDSFTYTVSDGNGGTDTATVTVNVLKALAMISVQIDTGPTASICIWDDTTGQWATDEDTGKLVDGTNHIATDFIHVAGGHYYYVWVEATDVIYYVESCPTDWAVASAPVGDSEAVYGCAATWSFHSVHFTIE